MKYDLFPCPFCGGDGITPDGIKFHSQPKLEETAESYWRIVCYGCGINTWNFPSKYKAIETWNRREGCV